MQTSFPESILFLLPYAFTRIINFSINKPETELLFGHYLTHL